MKNLTEGFRRFYSKDAYVCCFKMNPISMKIYMDGRRQSV